MRCTLALVFVLVIFQVVSAEWPRDLSTSNQDVLDELEREVEYREAPAEEDTTEDGDTVATEIPPEDTTDETNPTAPTDIPPPDETTAAPTDIPPPEETTAAPTDIPPPDETTVKPTDIPPPVETTAAPTDIPPPDETTAAPTDIPPPDETTAAPTVPPPIETTAKPTDIPPPDETTAAPTDVPPPDVTTEKDDSDKDRTSAILHELRGSCDVVSSVGPYFFSHFPEAPILDHTISLIPEDFIKGISLFVKAGKFAGNKRVYIRSLVDAIGFKIIMERMMCPGVKLQQAIIYVIRKELNTQMSTDDGTLYSKLLKIYNKWLPGETNYKHVMENVKFAHRIIFEEVIDYIVRSEFEGLTKMIGRLTKTFKRRSTRVDMTMDKWMKVLKRFLRGYAPLIQCPSRGRALRIFSDLINNVRMKIIDEQIKREVENTIKTLMVDHMDLSRVADVDAFIGDLAREFLAYEDRVIKQFNTFKKHLEEQNYTNLSEVVKDYLDDEQRKVMADLLQWLSNNS